MNQMFLFRRWRCRLPLWASKANLV